MPWPTTLRVENWSLFEKEAVTQITVNGSSGVGTFHKITEFRDVIWKIVMARTRPKQVYI